MAISLDPSSAAARDAHRDYGLVDVKHLRINEMLHDLDPQLSLRVIPERDPAYRPPKTMGVYEEGTQGAASPWVFTLAPEHVDERVVARVAAGDMSKLSPAEKMELLKKANQLALERDRKELAEKQAQRREEMLFIASSKKSTIRHKIDGETKILSDEIRSPRTYV